MEGWSNLYVTILFSGGKKVVKMGGDGVKVRWRRRVRLSRVGVGVGI
jgi:hypothetical protein